MTSLIVAVDTPNSLATCRIVLIEERLAFNSKMVARHAKICSICASVTLLGRPTVLLPVRLPFSSAGPTVASTSFPTVTLRTGAQNRASPSHLNSRHMKLSLPRSSSACVCGGLLGVTHRSGPRRIDPSSCAPAP